MDIVSRLKKFLAQEQIPVTQFADNCGIARPTISQLLNGRNKKVSDDVVRRIHASYPSLSVMWLMFGEGEMYVCKGSPSSPSMNVSQSIQEEGKEISPTLRFGEFEDSLEDDTQSPDNESFSKNSPDYNEITSVSIDFGSHYNSELDRIADDSEPSANIDASSSDSKDIVDALLSSTGNTAGKKIVNIIVYYDDNSYEAFVPR